MKKIIIVLSIIAGSIILLAGIVGVVLLGYYITDEVKSVSFDESTSLEESAGSEELLKRLSSPDRNTVLNTFYHLTERRDPIAREAAHKFLTSEDDYAWFNAALYLGALNDKEAIPYLIKGLKHPAWRSYDKVAGHLESMTGLKYGKDYDNWLAWWKAQNPDSEFNFRYLGLEKEASELNNIHHYLINGAVNPTTIDHIGPKIVLIGVKLKNESDREKAIDLLKRITDRQWVQFKFDNGPKLDKEGYRRAFVYWIREDDQDSRFDLWLLGENPPVAPFKKKTLINAYLLKSGLYEYDPDSVYDEGMRKTLEDAMR